MYKNIGKKIKGLAKAIFIIEALMIGIAAIGIAFTVFSGLLAGSMAMLEVYDLSDVGFVEIASIILAAIFVIIVLGLVFVIAVYLAYMSTWMLYAFGELVDKTCDIEKNTRALSENTYPYESVFQTEEVSSSDTAPQEENDTN